MAMANTRTPRSKSSSSTKTPASKSRSSAKRKPSSSSKSQRIGTPAVSSAKNRVAATSEAHAHAQADAAAPKAVLQSKESVPAPPIEQVPPKTAMFIPPTSSLQLQGRDPRQSAVPVPVVPPGPTVTFQQEQQRRWMQEATAAIAGNNIASALKHSAQDRAIELPLVLSEMGSGSQMTLAPGSTRKTQRTGIVALAVAFVLGLLLFWRQTAATNRSSTLSQLPPLQLSPVDNIQPIRLLPESLERETSESSEPVLLLLGTDTGIPIVPDNASNQDPLLPIIASIESAETEAGEIATQTAELAAQVSGLSDVVQSTTDEAQNMLQHFTEAAAQKNIEAEALAAQERDIQIRSETAIESAEMAVEVIQAAVDGSSQIVTLSAESKLTVEAAVAVVEAVKQVLREGKEESLGSAQKLLDSTVSANEPAMQQQDAHRDNVHKIHPRWLHRDTRASNNGSGLPNSVVTGEAEAPTKEQ